MLFGIAVVAFLNRAGGMAARLDETHAANIVADLSITQTNYLTQAVPGTQVVYSITVSNLSTETIINAVFLDASSPSYSPQRMAWNGVNAIASNGVLTTGQPIYYLMSFGPGGYLNLVITGTLRPDATGTLTNTAKITPPADVSDSNLGNNSSTDSDPIVASSNPMADLQISTSDGVTQVNTSQALSYTVWVTNAGPMAVAGVQITDVLPSGYQAISASASYHSATQRGLGFPAAGVLTATYDMLPSGVVMIVVHGSVKPTVSTDLTNTATVTMPVMTTDPDGTNNVAVDMDMLIVRPKAYLPLIQK